MHSVTDKRNKTAFRKSWIYYHNNCISKDFGAQTKYMKWRNIHYSFKKRKGKDQYLLSQEGQNRQKVEGIHCRDWGTENGNCFSKVLVGVSKKSRFIYRCILQNAGS